MLIRIAPYILAFVAGVAAWWNQHKVLESKTSPTNFALEPSPRKPVKLLPLSNYDRSVPDASEPIANQAPLTKPPAKPVPKPKPNSVKTFADIIRQIESSGRPAPGIPTTIIKLAKAGKLDLNKAETLGRRDITPFMVAALYSEEVTPDQLWELMQLGGKPEKLSRWYGSLAGRDPAYLSIMQSNGYFIAETEMEKIAEAAFGRLNYDLIQHIEANGVSFKPRSYHIRSIKRILKTRGSDRAISQAEYLIDNGLSQDKELITLLQQYREGR